MRIASREVKMKAGDILIFRASLKPDIIRDIEIAATASLYKFAEAINDAFGFDFDHCFGFYDKLTGSYFKSKIAYELFADMGENNTLSVKKNTVLTAFPRDKAKMLFVFDYGDEWHFIIERIGSGEKAPGVKYPRVAKSVGIEPPQYEYPEEDD